MVCKDSEYNVIKCHKVIISCVYMYKSIYTSKRCLHVCNSSIFTYIIFKIFLLTSFIFYFSMEPVIVISCIHKIHKDGMALSTLLGTTNQMMEVKKQRCYKGFFRCL